MTERIGHRLTRALHRLLGDDERLFLLGQDIADPAGGAFGITRGLSSGYPDRVWSTPISEEATVGVAAGLALCGDRAVVEIMFGDFLMLCADPLVNFAAKAVSMYGRRVPVGLVVRCPVGGNRGYGPTHSQNPQKHFLGVPHLGLYELTPFGDPIDVLRRMFGDRQPGILFEEKSLYPLPGYDGGTVDDIFGYRFLDEAAGTVLVSATDDDPDRLLITPGGLVPRALSAMRRALLDHDLLCQLVVPSRLYPLDLDPVLALAARAGAVVVVEDGVDGGGWGAEVARHLHERLWRQLREPVRLVRPRCAVIPAAAGPERALLVQDSTILTALGVTVPDLSVPRLNANDTDYVLLEWLVPDGVRVTAGTPVVLVETSKTVEEIVAPADGHLRHRLPAGATCRPGDLVAGLSSERGTGHMPDTATAPGDGTAAGSGVGEPVLTKTARELVERHGIAAADVAGLGLRLVREVDVLRLLDGAGELPAHQRRVARTVATSHATVPTAYVVLRVGVDALLDRQRGSTDGFVGLPEFVVHAAAPLRAGFPDLFATVGDDLRIDYATRSDVAVTMDTGGGLYLPVIRRADELTLAETARRLMALRIRALRGRLTEADLAGASITLSLHTQPGVVHARPFVVPGQTCVLSLCAVQEELYLDGAGRPRPRRYVHLGAAYDHRAVNGRQAVEFLTAIRDRLERPPVGAVDLGGTDAAAQGGGPP